MYIKRIKELPDPEEAKERIDRGIESIISTVQSDEREIWGHTLRVLISALKSDHQALCRETDSCEKIEQLASLFHDIEITLLEEAQKAKTEKELEGFVQNPEKMVQAIRNRFQAASKNGDNRFPDVSLRTSDFEESSNLEEMVEKLKKAGLKETDIINASRLIYPPPRAG